MRIPALGATGNYLIGEEFIHDLAILPVGDIGWKQIVKYMVEFGTGEASGCVKVVSLHH